MVQKLAGYEGYMTLNFGAILPRWKSEWPEIATPVRVCPSFLENGKALSLQKVLGDKPSTRFKERSWSSTLHSFQSSGELSGVWQT